MHLVKMKLYSYLQVKFQQRNNNKLAWNGNLIEQINVLIFTYEFVLILRQQILVQPFWVLDLTE